MGFNRGKREIVDHSLPSPEVAAIDAGELGKAVLGVGRLVDGLVFEDCNKGSLPTCKLPCGLQVITEAYPPKFTLRPPDYSQRFDIYLTRRKHRLVEAIFCGTFDGRVIGYEFMLPLAEQRLVVSSAALAGLETGQLTGLLRLIGRFDEILGRSSDPNLDSGSDG